MFGSASIRLALSTERQADRPGGVSSGPVLDRNGAPTVNAVSTNHPEPLTVEEIETFEPGTERERLSFDLGYEDGFERATLAWVCVAVRQMIAEIDEILAQTAVQS